MVIQDLTNSAMQKSLFQRLKEVLSPKKTSMSEERDMNYKRRADITDGTVVKCGRNII